MHHHIHCCDDSKPNSFYQEASHTHTYTHTYIYIYNPFDAGNWQTRLFISLCWLSSCVTYLLIYLLTYSMVQSPSWTANWFAASQEISRIPKVHYRTHKRPPPVSILGQPNPVHIPHPTSCRSILILSTHLRLGLPSGPILSGFPSKTLYTPLYSPIRATWPAHLIHSRFYHLHNIGCGVQII